MASPEKAGKDNCNRLPLSDEDHKDWLELGLGFSIACSSSRKQDQENPNIFSVPVSASSKVRLAKQQKLPGCSTSAGLELGLSLGIDLESRGAPAAGLGLDLQDEDDGHEHEHGVVRRVLDMVAPAAGNYDHQSLWQNQDHNYEDDDNDDDDDMAWLPCDMNPGSYLGGGLDIVDDWQMPVPNNINSHDYYYLSRTTSTRPHSASGLWFTLHSYSNWNGEALPQIPKAYIRVKDENVTIFMVKKYLVRKLGLSNEAEVEISCMGQKLMHTQTLKQVRDCVWLPTLLESVSFQNYSHQSNCVNNHLMSLHYGRQCANLN